MDKKKIGEQCVNCFNCKKRGNEVYCKLGVWTERAEDVNKIRYHIPQEFGCPSYEEA